MTLFQSWGFLVSDYPRLVGGTPIFSYIYIGSEHYFWFKISEKYYVWEYEDLWILGGGGSLRNQTIFFFYYFFFFFFFFGGGGHF